MRYHLLAFLVLISWYAEARKGRKNARNNSEFQRLNLERNEIETEAESWSSSRQFSNSVEVPQSHDIEANGLGANRSKKLRKRKKSRQELNISENNSGNPETLQEEMRKELLRSTMRNMFGFEHMDAPRVTHGASFDIEDDMEERSLSTPQTTAPRNQFDSRHHVDVQRQRYLPDPPDFMLELYRSYSEDKSRMLINSISQGNTVRSFYSVAGESPNRLQDKGKPMIILPYFRGRKLSRNGKSENAGNNRNQMRVFAFNVSSIPQAESIVAAELRLNGLRNIAIQNHASGIATNTSATAWTAVIAVYRVSNRRNDENNTRNVYQRIGDFVTIRPNSSYSWIDRSISSLASRSRRSNHVLIVKFDDGSEDQLMRRKRDATDSNPGRTQTQSLSLELPSFFVVISDRAKRNSGDHPPTISLRLSPILIVYCNDTTAEIIPTTSVHDSEEIQLLSTLEKLNPGSTKHKRLKRSAGQRTHNNSLSPSNEEDSNEFPGESPRPPSDVVDNDQTELHDNRRSERRVIQSLKDRNTISQKRKNKKRKRGRKCRKRGRKGKKSRKCKQEKTATPVEPALNRAQKICSRKSLHVDFEDMGWADWIISPKSFDSYYCSGLCEFDTMKKASPSNHAIIQAFIKAFEINTDVPAPCCVPEKLMSLSVLFFDKDDNVVLKVFPNMSVESCACR